MPGTAETIEWMKNNGHAAGFFPKIFAKKLLANKKTNTTVPETVGKGCATRRPSVRCIDREVPVRTGFIGGKREVSPFPEGCIRKGCSSPAFAGPSSSGTSTQLPHLRR